MQRIKVVGALWCEDTLRTLEHLREINAPFEFFNVDEDPDARQWCIEQNDGKQRTPTLDLGGTILVEPSNEELDGAIERAG